MRLVITVLASLFIASPVFANVTHTYYGTGYSLSVVASDNNSFSATTQQFNGEWQPAGSQTSTVDYSTFGVSLGHIYEMQADYFNSLSFVLTLNAGYTLQSMYVGAVNKGFAEVGNDPFPSFNASQTFKTTGPVAGDAIFSNVTHSVEHNYGPSSTLSFDASLGFDYGMFRQQNDGTLVYKSSGITGLSFDGRYAVDMLPGRWTGDTGAAGIQFTVAKAVPEPETWALMGLGLVAVVTARKRRTRP